MINWFKNNKKGFIRGMFLIPILLVMIISISHVVSWYTMANPLTWAIYLSIAIEIAAMSSISAASVKIKGGVWLVFIIVTLIQFIGNIFFCYNKIDVNTPEFKSWVELTGPIFESFGSDIKDIIAQKRWLALLEGGLLPIISLASLHFFIKYGGNDEQEVLEENKKELIIENEIKDIKDIKDIKVEDTPKQESDSNPLVMNILKRSQNVDKWA
jgi:hypothetical protein